MPNLYAIKDSANVQIMSKSDGSVLLYADYAKMSDNSWSASRVYAKSKDIDAIGFDSEKKSELKMSFEVFDLGLLEMLTGTSFTTGATDLYAREMLVVGAGNTVTFVGTPKVGTLSVHRLNDDGVTIAAVEILGTPATTPEHYSVASQVVTLNATSAPVGTKIAVYYQKVSGVTAKQLKFQASKFPTNVKIVGDTMIRNSAGVDSLVQICYLNAKAKADFTLTYSASDITTIDITFDLFKDTVSDDMVTFTII